MKATTVLRWVIALLLLGLITSNLLAQPPSVSPDPAYPWADAEQTLEPYPLGPYRAPTAADSNPAPQRDHKASVEPTVQSTPFVPSLEDIARARRYGEYAEGRLLSDEGWWK